MSDVLGKPENTYKVITRKQFTNVLMIAYPIMYFLFRRNEVVESESTIDASFIIFSGYTLFLSLFCCYYMYTESGLVKTIKRTCFSSQKYFVFYLLFGAVSTIWSVSPLYSFYHAFFALTFFVAITNFVNDCDDEKELLNFVILWCAVLIPFEMVDSYMTTESDSIVDKLHGAASIQAAIGMIFSFRLLGKKKNILYYGYILFFAFITIITTSLKIYLAIIFAYLSSIVFLKARTLQKQTIKLLLISISTSMLLLLLYSIFFGSLLQQDLGRIEHLSGRLPSWIIMLQKFSESWLLGYGFSQGDQIEVGDNFTIMNAHNMYIGAALYTGVLGLSLLLMFSWSVVCVAFKERNRHPYLWVCIVIVFVNGMANLGLGGKVNLPWMVSVFVITILMRLTRFRVKVG